MRRGQRDLLHLAEKRSKCSRLGTASMNVVPVAASRGPVSRWGTCRGVLKSPGLASARRTKPVGLYGVEETGEGGGGGAEVGGGGGGFTEAEEVGRHDGYLKAGVAFAAAGVRGLLP